MTTSQIQAALPGISFNNWITLENFCRGMSIEPDYKIFVNPIGMQFYFDTTNELLFTRDTAIRPEILRRMRRTNADVTIHTLFDDKDHTVTLEDGGIEDSTVGRYHSVYSFENIIIFF